MKCRNGGIDVLPRAVRDGMHERIKFLRFREDVARVLSACDALVAPTRYEAYGVGVHEALYCGLPAMFPRALGSPSATPMRYTDCSSTTPRAPRS